MKKLTVLVSGAPEGSNLREIELMPGTSAGDVLRNLGLSGYLLSREGSAQAFAEEEQIYNAIQDGEKLRATPIAEVGAGALDWLKTMLLRIGLLQPDETPSERVRVAPASRRVQPVWTPRAAPLEAEIIEDLRVTGGAVRIRPDGRPLWQVRGWQALGNKLVGAYRTPRGSFAGEIHKGLIGRHRFFILNPPAALLNGPHRTCFRPRGSGVFLIHFGIDSPNIDAGIVGIEKLIVIALNQNGKR